MKPYATATTGRETVRNLTTLFAALLLSLTLGLGLAQEENLDITIGQALVEDESFSTLVSLLEQAGLLETLNGAGPYTVFTPDNTAFEKLDPSVLETLNSDPALLEQVLLGHVVEGTYGINDLQDIEEGTLNSLQGDALDFNLNVGGLDVNNAEIDSTNVGNNYANGVTHDVGDVVVPASLMGQLGIVDAEAAGSGETGGMETGGESEETETGGETGGVVVATDAELEETGGMETGGMEETGGAETGGMETGGMETGGMAETGGETGGTETGGGADQDLFAETQDILADPANADVDAAVANIEAWQERLRDAGDDALTAIADQLEILKTELEADSPDSETLATVLADLSQMTQEAAQNASGDAAEALSNLAEQLSQ